MNLLEQIKFDIFKIVDIEKYDEASQKQINQIVKETIEKYSHIIQLNDKIINDLENLKGLIINYIEENQGE